MEYTKITESIFQIADDEGVYCTLVKGKNSAVLFDTGYGRLPLRQFVESLISTGYIVINSHCHPDHVGGNGNFETIYASETEFDAIRSIYAASTGKEPSFALKNLNIGQVIDIGGIGLKVVSLAGHTQGSIGLLMEKERILLAGDAMNPVLWMFPPGAASVSCLIDTLHRAIELPFENYIFGHSDKMLPRGFIGTILKNAESLSIDGALKQHILDIECYECRYSDEYGESSIIFREDQI